jgi:hypothetical protein
MIAAFAALLATAAAAGGGASGAARLVASAERALSLAASGGCPAGPERAVADADAGRLPPDAAKAVDAAREDLRLYFACRAYAAGDAAPCAALARTPARVAYSVDKSALKRPDTVEFLCVSDWDDMRMARATIAGDRAGFIAACRAHDAAGHRDFARGRTEEACGILAGGASDPADACRRLGPLFSNPLPAGFCEGELRQFSGDEEHCRGIEGQPASRELCLGYAAWKKARAGGGADACAGSPVCAVLDGRGPEACAPLAARAVAGVCAAHYTPRALERAGRDLDAAEKLLAADAAAARPAPEAARAADALSERAARARLALARLRAPKEKEAAP